MAAQIQFNAAKKILALDVATKTGHAHSCGDSGTFLLGSSHPGYELRRFILSIHADRGIKQIAMEYSAFGGSFKKVKDFHNQLLGVVREVCAELEIPQPTLINPMTLKKFWTGSGRADKAQMIAACETWLGYRPRDDNEADALAALAYADQGYQPQKKATKKRKPKTKLKQSKLF